MGSPARRTQPRPRSNVNPSKRLILSLNVSIRVNWLVLADQAAPVLDQVFEHFVGLRAQVNQFVAAQQEAASEVEGKFVEEMNSLVAHTCSNPGSPKRSGHPQNKQRSRNFRLGFRQISLR